jgi:hypothetical protein
MNRIIIIFLAFGLFACKPDEPTPTASEQEAIIESLQGTWSAQEVRKENAVISDFSDFTLTINDKSYTTENGAPIWPSSGTFDFENTEIEDEFVRQDGRLFTASVNNGTLAITIVYQEETARGEYGTYEFVME